MEDVLQDGQFFIPAANDGQGCLGDNRLVHDRSSLSQRIGVMTVKRLKAALAMVMVRVAQLVGER